MCAPVFVPHTPILHLMRVSISIIHSLLSEHTFMVKIAIFNPVAHFFWGSCAGIGTNVGFCSHFFAKFYIFIGSKCIAFLNSPGFVKRGDSLFADSFFPIIRRNKTSSRPANNGCLNFFQSFNYINSETIFISKFRCGIKNP